MARKIELQIVGDASSLDRAFRQAGASATGFGSKMRTASRVVGTAAIAMGAAVTAGLVVTLKRGFDELADSQKVMAQTNAVLKSTGGIANVTAKEVSDLATAISLKSGIDDEAIQASENLLLTFKQVRNEVGKGNDIFDQATQAAADLSTAGFGSLESASKMLGKALNDPIKGMTAMGRAGVTFTQSQKDTIKSLVETGRSLEAQKLILKEVQSQVGGSAEAYGNTLPGQLAKARNAFDEIAGNVAVKFLPILTQLLNWVNANWPTISAVIGGAATAIISAFRAIGVAVNWLRNQWEIHRDTVIRVWTAVQSTVQRTIEWFKANIVPPIQTIVAAARALWDRFGADIMRIVQTVFPAVITAVKTFVQNMLAPFQIFLDLLRGDWRAAWNEIKATVSRTLGAIVALLKAAVSAWMTAAKALGKAILDGVVAGITGIGEKVGTYLGYVKQALFNLIGAAYNLAKDIGRGIVAGVRDGFWAVWNGVKDSIVDAVLAVPRFLKGALKIGSPSKLMADEIGKPMAEGVKLGWLLGTVDLPTKMSDTLRNAITKAQSVIQANQASFRTAWQRFADDAMRAFDAATDAGIARIQAKLNAALARIDAQLAAKLKKIAGQQGALTPAEQELANLNAAESKRQLDTELAAAQQALADAQAGGNADEIKAAEERLRQAVLAIARASLEEQARLEREEADKRAAAQTARAEAEAERKRKQAANQYANRQKEYEAERALHRRHLEDFLAQSEALLEKYPELWQKIHKRIMRKFKDTFGPDFQVAGENLGGAFAKGLRNGLDDMEDAAEILARKIAKYLKLNSPSEEGPLSDLDKWAKPFAATWIKGLDTRAISGAFNNFGITPKIGGPGLSSAGAGGATIVIPVYLDGEKIAQVTTNRQRVQARQGVSSPWS